MELQEEEDQYIIPVEMLEDGDRKRTGMVLE